MCDNLRKSEQVVSDVAATIVIDYAEELKKCGKNKEQIRLEVAKFIASPRFLEAVKQKVDEYIAKFDDSEKLVRLH